MKSLFDRATADETIERVERLTPGTKRLWGKMNVAQMLTHCALLMEMAVGDRRPKRMLIGRVLGPFLKGIATNDKPMEKNSPTDPTVVVADEREFGTERERLEGLIRRFRLADRPAVQTIRTASMGG